MISLAVNGHIHQAGSNPDKPLLWVLRDELALKGTKYGCGVGVCGACVVLLDGEPNHACMVPLRNVGAREVTTIEGLAEDHPLIRAWIAQQTPQCGYCQPGQILTAAALLTRHRDPCDGEIDAALAGVLCRCGTYQRIRLAIHAAARSDAGDTAPAHLPQLLDALPANAGTALNEWIWINRDSTVTVMINHSEMGQGALAGLLTVFAEELDVELEQMRTVFAPAAARYGHGLWKGQFTGGSSSIRAEWQRLREVAAQTRSRLVAAAARRWEVALRACSAGSGRVTHAQSGRALTYGELAEAAAQLDPPQQARLKSPADFRLIGRAQPRPDIPAMVLGRTRYGIDVALPGMRVATVARCPVFGGRAASFRAQAALAVPGVRQVTSIASGVAVVGDDFWCASRGRDALEIEWDFGDAERTGNAALERQLLHALNESGVPARRRGDARRALKGATRVVEAVYHTPLLAHATIEPMNCVAHVRDDACDVWVGTQDQAATRAAAARAAGLPEECVHVHTQFLGGGFGRRLETDFVVEAVELSRRLGEPVQVLWTRADDLQHDFYRPAHAARLQAVLNRQGLPAAWLMRVAGPETALEGIHLPYAVANMREEHVRVAYPVPTGPWRSVGCSNNAFAIESFIDELAHAAGRDPLEYRLALLAEAPRHRATLQLAAGRAGWGAPLRAGHGRGIAVYEGFGSVMALVAEVSVANGVLRVERVVGTIDCGLVVTPDAARAQLEGGVAFGLSATLHEAVRVEAGRVQQADFRDYPLLTLPEMPQVEVHFVPSEAPPGGVGELAVPVIAPAVANAVFAATGERLRRLPLRLGTV